MSYLFNRVMNESYTYSGYNIDISDPVEFSLYCNECATNFYKTEAAMYALETNNICALIEARAVKDVERIKNISGVMEGFFGNLFKGIINFVKKIINAIVNFFKKLFSSSSSSGGGGGGGGAIRDDGKPVVEEPPKDESPKNITVNVTIYPIDNLCTIMDNIAVEAIDNINKFDSMIRTWWQVPSKRGEMTRDLASMSPDDFFKKHLKDRYMYLTQAESYYPMFAYQFVTKDPNYKRLTMNINEYSTSMEVKTYESFTKSKLTTIEKGITEYEKRVKSIYDGLDELRRKKLEAGSSGIHTYDDGVYRDDDDTFDETPEEYSSRINRDTDESEEYHDNTGMSSRQGSGQYELDRWLQSRHSLNARSFRTKSIHPAGAILYTQQTRVLDFYNILNEVQSFKPAKYTEEEQIYMTFIELAKRLTVKSTIMLQKTASVLGTFIKKDVEQYAAIYNTKKKYGLV